MRPIIGVTVWKENKDANTYEKVNEWNLKAIEDFGGIPVMLHITNDDEVIEGYIKILDGIYLTGGGDINPLLFNEEPIKELGNVEYDRDNFEIKLYKKAAEKDIPILGVCRGMQLMNVAEGGNVYQDIYSQRPETNNHSYKYIFDGNEFHTVVIKENSKIFEILNKTEIKTNSYHHQAVNELAPSFVATAFGKDGVVECIESTKLKYAIGIQWHPEVMYVKYPLFGKIFKSFINAAIK